MAPGAILGIWSSYAAEMTMLPELVGAFNGFGGLAAALEGIGLYLDPTATYLVRNGKFVAPQTNPMVRRNRPRR
jgi:NAD/NADP transhydrogenase beta subunit